MSKHRSQPQPEPSPRGPASPAEPKSPRPDDSGGREWRWRRLEARLRGAERWLRDQGTVVRKMVDGRPCWVVRYVVRDQGKQIHKSIYLTTHDPELLRRARARVARYRREGDELRQLARWLALGRDAERAARGF